MKGEYEIIARERERKGSEYMKGVQMSKEWAGGKGRRELQLWVQVYLEWLSQHFRLSVSVCVLRSCCTTASMFVSL